MVPHTSLLTADRIDVWRWQDGTTTNKITIYAQTKAVWAVLFLCIWQTYYHWSWIFLTWTFDNCIIDIESVLLNGIDVQNTCVCVGQYFRISCSQLIYRQLRQWWKFYYLEWRFKYGNFITVTSWWARWYLKSPASRLFTHSFIQTQIKDNIKAPRHWS